MPKITLIGAGSFGFGRRLLADVLSFPELSESHISLMDIDEKKLALVESLVNKLLEDTGVGATIEVTSDRRLALDGADYVLTTIRVGDDYNMDKGIPLKYGLDQSVADTIGPGGEFTNDEASYGVQEFANNSCAFGYVQRYGGAMSRRTFNELYQPDGDKLLGD